MKSMAQHQPSGGSPPTNRYVIWLTPENNEERAALNELVRQTTAADWTGLDDEMVIVALQL